jgi:hypothetical protein
VLLYSGPERIFEPKDSDLLLEDLLALNAFFISKDDKGNAEGLSEELVNSYSAPLKTIISNMFEFATEYLIEHYPNASTDPQQIMSKQKVRSLPFLCIIIYCRFCVCWHIDQIEERRSLSRDRKRHKSTNPSRRAPQ